MKNNIAYKLKVELNDKGVQLSSIGTINRQSLVLILLKIFRGLRIKDVMPREIAVGLMLSVYDEDFQKRFLT